MSRVMAATCRAGDREAGLCKTGAPGAPVPGGVYLCQVDEDLSCGACCGLYNLSKADEASVRSLLEARTAAFSNVPRRIDTIADFGKRVAEAIEDRRPISDFHHCPYIGLIGKNRSRVGCLLHPLASGNHGIDFRGLSHYGGMACRIYFCPSHEALSPVWKRIVQQTAGNWYLYGLVITEDELLAGLFGAVEEAIGRPLTDADIVDDPKSVRALQGLLQLKCSWPFRPGHIPGPVNYFFKDRNRTRPPVAYPAPRAHSSRFDAVFRALGSAFDSEAALADAEARIRTPISVIVERITGSR
jgi:hypothetical protein